MALHQRHHHRQLVCKKEAIVFYFNHVDYLLVTGGLRFAVSMHQHCQPSEMYLFVDDLSIENLEGIQVDSLEERQNGITNVWVVGKSQILF